ncbi:MAG: hypothetical protein A2902_06885 [Elusimicrobia bacterium RIFCSPLOWO2_01_FULL_64_13]|nr:MAG: hypothetical protein A2636_04110 [Elusimicrobia bacterium RIFCSPHIGHO2_01_FULL_64_10]OGR97459.1 MAG: hypothetical protein A2902_06885 [Elusimicrobia bacterium RIFCSPLOWO2_01_FULL_64_13]
MKARPIQVRRFKDAKGGYRVLASWRRPERAVREAKVDLWIPELAPRVGLMRSYRQGRIGWKELNELYACQLRSPEAQNLLKPLALLSVRRNMVLLCDCPGGTKCPNRVLIQELESCRRDGNFALKLHERDA